MKIGRIIGGFLSMLIVMGAINFSLFKDSQNINSSYGLVDASGVMSDTIQYENKPFNDSDNSNVEILTYTNNNNYQVNISSSDILISCVGTGDNAYNDVELVENNFKINATFAKKSNGQRYDSLTVLKNEKVYIYVSTEYVGEKYPLNEVKCDYSINVEAY